MGAACSLADCRFVEGSAYVKKKHMEAKGTWKVRDPLAKHPKQALMSLPKRMHGNGSNGVASLFTQQGRKGVNQDTMVVFEEFGFTEDTVFCGVFDGHGPFGHLVAQTVRDMLPPKLLSHWQDLNGKSLDPNGELVVTSGGAGDSSLASTTSKDVGVVENPEPTGNAPSFSLWKESFLESFKAMDKDLQLNPNVDCFCSGTTAVTLVKQGRDVFIGNVGDSRAILVTRTDNNEPPIAVQLTIDLKPNLPQEAERIRQCNGRVFALSDEPDVHRVWLPRDNSPGLAMARAFGDLCLKHYGVIAVPEVTHYQLTERDQFIVLATDGVWDVLSNEEVASIVASVSSRTLAAKAIVESAVHTWRKKYPTSRVDDCAVVCLYVDGQTEFIARKKSFFAKKNASDATSKPSTSALSIDREVVDGNMSETIEIPLNDQEWMALEGVTRVNSILRLPRFFQGNQKAGG